MNSSAVGVPRIGGPIPNGWLPWRRERSKSWIDSALGMTWSGARRGTVFGQMGLRCYGARTFTRNVPFSTFISLDGTWRSLK